MDLVHGRSRLLLTHRRRRWCDSPLEFCVWQGVSVSACGEVENTVGFLMVTRASAPSDARHNPVGSIYQEKGCWDSMALGTQGRAIFCWFTFCLLLLFRHTATALPAPTNTPPSVKLRHVCSSSTSSISLLGRPIALHLHNMPALKIRSTGVPSIYYWERIVPIHLLSLASSLVSAPQSGIALGLPRRYSRRCCTRNHRIPGSHYAMAE